MPYRNPAEKHCWKLCPACFKCANKNDAYSECRRCSGRNDPLGRIEPRPEVFCDCANGVLRHQTQTGRIIIRTFKSNPFKTAGIQVDTETEDERDWNEYLRQAREILDDPYWDPIRFNDGTSTDSWTKEQRGFGAS